MSGNCGENPVVLANEDHKVCVVYLAVVVDIRAALIGHVRGVALKCVVLEREKHKIGIIDEAIEIQVGGVGRFDPRARAPLRAGVLMDAAAANETITAASTFGVLLRFFMPLAFPRGAPSSGTPRRPLAFSSTRIVGRLPGRPKTVIRSARGRSRDHHDAVQSRSSSRRRCGAC